MPVSGGATDKFGNWYEALWAIDQLLRIVDADATSLILEPLGSTESKGIEFTVSHADGSRDYWSVKRQTTKIAGWTVALLTAEDENGRSILGDLFLHIARAETNHGVFASTLGAQQLEELRSHATNEVLLKARLESSQDLNMAFGRIRAICGNDTEQARRFLLRLRTHAADESQLRDRLHVLIRKIFYQEDGLALSPAVVRGHLGDLLRENIHLPINRELILADLEKKGIRLREWALDRSVLQRVSAICESYVAPLKSDLIANTLLPIVPTESILSPSGLPTSRKTLVVGGAGSGKSSVLADIVTRLREQNTPVLAIRFDQIPDGIVTTTELGRKLLLPESPSLVIAALAHGGPCVLVIDQLDAVSIASGRRTELWALFDELRRETERFPSLYLLVGCREFDLQHDHRMRTMKAGEAGFTTVGLSPLSFQQVDAILQQRGIDPNGLQASIKPLLTLPLHLSIFLRLDPAARLGVRNRDELFDSFWMETERRTDHRLGRKAAWTQVIDRLANWLSDRQQLSAPKDVLDDFGPDARAMASEHVLVLADGRYRFFHESFFDYAFARRFAASGQKLSDMLLGGEQHLFRRAQVRQILAYLRSQDTGRYLEELEFVLGEQRVRFHIKRVVLQWLSSSRDPWLQEWELLQQVRSEHSELYSHVTNTVAAMPSWFDVLENAHFFDACLASEEDARVNEAIWMLSLHPIKEARSDRVAAILRKHRKAGQKWSDYLRHICRTGDVYHTREMFDLFLSLIDDGTLDSVRPGFAVNDSWWTVLYSMASEKPDMASEAIGHWLDRMVSAWQGAADKAVEDMSTSSLTQSLQTALDRSGNGAHVIYMAAKSSSSYAEQLLPRLAKFAEKTAKEIPNHLDIDPVWYFRGYGDQELQVHAAILSGLALALETLARESPKRLDQILMPYLERPHDVIAYLTLRAWTAAPQQYADWIAEYLASDTRRLKVGYAMWAGGGGSGEIYVSTQAIRVASPLCSPENLIALEKAILAFKDPGEARTPRSRGYKQLELLRSLDASRLSPAGGKKLRELQRKFPSFSANPPEPFTVTSVSSPIPKNAQQKMSDDQWLRAMHKYAGASDWRTRGGDLSGGEYELAFSLQQQALVDPVRFASLATRMEDALPSSYFDALLRGVANSFERTEPAKTKITLDQAAVLIRRVHAIPQRPSGRAVMDLVQRWKGSKWPTDILEVVAWYAINDPDPQEEIWQVKSQNGLAYHGGEPFSAGINSTRGSAASAIEQILFDTPQYFAVLESAVYSLAHDKSVAVRSCAIRTLLPLLNIDVKKAIGWFRECLDSNPVLLTAPHLEHFIYHAGPRDYPALQDVTDEMMRATDPKVVEAGARVVSVLSLTVESAKPQADSIRKGSVVMRKAAAHVYAGNISHTQVGETCRRLLKSFFVDEDEVVRAEAASAFHHLGELSTPDQSDLLAAFFESMPGKKELEPVVRALEDSPVQLPDLVCKFAKICVDAFQNEGGDIRTWGAAVAMDLSKIVVRLYTQTDDKKIQSQCLSLIDDMERYNFMGLSEELHKLDR
jgi:hypothetical protein